MKRTPLKRGTSRLSRSPLSRGTKRLKRSRLKSRSRKRKEANKLWRVAKAEAYRLAHGRCALCIYTSFSKTYEDLDVHHVCSKARGVSHEALNFQENLSVLCRPCHDFVHANPDHHLIKSRDFLDSLTKE